MDYWLQYKCIEHLAFDTIGKKIGSLRCNLPKYRCYVASDISDICNYIACESLSAKVNFDPL
jgi:hypothetical protein